MLINNSKNDGKCQFCILFKLLSVFIVLLAFMTSQNAVAQSTSNFRHGWVFCEPVKLPNSRLKMVPAAYVVLSGIEKASVPSTIKMSESNGYENICGESEYPLSIVGGIVVTNTVTGFQSVVMSNTVNGIPRIFIENIIYPDESCRDGKGMAPCRFVLVFARSEDTNGDNALGKDDSLVVFLVDTITSIVTRVTDPNLTVLGYTWMPDSGVLTFTVRGDANNDNEYTFDDGQELIQVEYDYSLQPKPVINSQTRKELHGIRVYP